MGNQWDDYAEFWDEVAYEYADKAFEELTKLVSLKGLRILDFGCGTGLLSERMSSPAAEIVALDNSSKMMEQLIGKNLSNVVPLCISLDEKLMDNSKELAKPFDLIVASSVCGFLPNYGETLGLLVDLLKPQGLFVQWDWLKQSEDADSGLDPDYIQEVQGDSGLKDVRISYPFEMSSEGNSLPVIMAWGKK